MPVITWPFFLFQGKVAAYQSFVLILQLSVLTYTIFLSQKAPHTAINITLARHAKHPHTILIGQSDGVLLP